MRYSSATYRNSQSEPVETETHQFKKSSWLRWFAPSIGVLLILSLAFTWVFCAKTVESGHRFVVTSFGKATGRVLEPGLNFIAPWQFGVYIDTRLTEVKEGNIDVTMSGGLQVSLDSSIWYFIDPQPDSLVRLVNGVGVDSISSLIISAKRNVARDIGATFTYEDLYSTNRVSFGQKMYEQLRELLGPKGLVVERVLLRGITPPNSTAEAQERKAAAQQAAEAMQYTIEKESLEITRKQKEAEGIAAANKAIASSLSAEYLQWYYIKALEGLAHSTNTTFVIAPYDQKLLPMLNISPGSNR